MSISRIFCIISHWRFNSPTLYSLVNILWQLQSSLFCLTCRNRLFLQHRLFDVFLGLLSENSLAAISLFKAWERQTLLNTTMSIPSIDPLRAQSTVLTINLDQLCTPHWRDGQSIGKLCRLGVLPLSGLDGVHSKFRYPNIRFSYVSLEPHSLQSWIKSSCSPNLYITGLLTQTHLVPSMKVCC